MLGIWKNHSLHVGEFQAHYYWEVAWMDKKVAIYTHVFSTPFETMMCVLSFLYYLP